MLNSIRRRLIFVIACLALFGGFLFSVSVAEAQINLLANPGAESGFTNWTTYNNVGYNFGIIDTTAVKAPPLAAVMPSLFSAITIPAAAYSTGCSKKYPPNRVEAFHGGWLRAFQLGTGNNFRLSAGAMFKPTTGTMLCFEANLSADAGNNTLCCRYRSAIVNSVISRPTPGSISR